MRPRPVTPRPLFSSRLSAARHDARVWRRAGPRCAVTKRRRGDFAWAPSAPPVTVSKQHYTLDKDPPPLAVPTVVVRRIQTGNRRDQAFGLPHSLVGTAHVPSGGAHIQGRARAHRLRCAGPEERRRLLKRLLCTSYTGKPLLDGCSLAFS